MRVNRVNLNMVLLRLGWIKRNAYYDLSVQFLSRRGVFPFYTPVSHVLSLLSPN